MKKPHISHFQGFSSAQPSPARVFQTTGSAEHGRTLHSTVHTLEPARKGAAAESFFPRVLGCLPDPTSAAPTSRDSYRRYGGGGVRGEPSAGGAPGPALRSGVRPLRPQVLPGHQLQVSRRSIPAPASRETASLIRLGFWAGQQTQVPRR